MNNTIKIYNSLTRKKEEFIPINSPQVNIYTCGVTVYDESHIGHARSLYIFDVIRKYLKYRNFKVNFVRNITDIDDKIINRANELKVDWKDLVKKYIDRYDEDLKSLGINKGDFEPRATENIEDMVKYIQALIDKGYAYESGGDVYFNVRKFPTYGKLSGQSIDQMETGVRIEPTGHKKDPLDFALWKSSKEGEPSWDSPWQKGRPGWHIECSVMSQKFLKTDTLDIHAGGRDLIFPHHENEIAQAEALTGKPFAKYWIHHGLLTINGQKMAKSLGNFITIRDILQKYNSDILKLFFLSVHYSSPIDFSWEIMEEKKEAFDGIIRFLRNVERARNEERLGVRIPDTNKILDSDIKSEIERLRSKFESYMDDNFHTPLALTSIFGICRICEGIPFYDTYEKEKHFEILDYAKKNIIDLGKVLGLSFSLDKIEEIDPKLKVYVELKIKEREEARRVKDFKKADSIRKELEAKGIILEDTKDGKTTWRRKL